MVVEILQREPIALGLQTPRAGWVDERFSHASGMPSRGKYVVLRFRGWSLVPRSTPG